MPPICLHLGIAQRAISGLQHWIVNENQGSYYLGSTVPDIRSFIDASREETHFLSLECEDGASGVKAMFKAHPELNHDANLNPATQAFVAGYLSHLVTDEAWIYQIYRPFFGKLSPLKGEPVANLMDRILQFELDRRERLATGNMAAIRTYLDDATSGITVSFIDGPSLARWREFVSGVMTRKASWEGFRYFAERNLSWMQQIPAEEREVFFTSFNTRVNQVVEMVSEEKLLQFREQSITDSVRVAREYLA